MGRGCNAGQVIDVAELFDRYWKPRVILDGAGLRVWTPTQDAVLLVPRPGYPTLTLELKDETLHRWLLGRVDLAAPLREGIVTAYGAGDAALHGVCVGIPHTPWAFHMLDWI
jgi:hypothetical protein